VFTTDAQRGYGVAARVRSSTFGVNQGYIVDPAAHFGVKNSGYGRELGAEGIDSYIVSQSISLAG
jgi:acyl-CoA reductase-like NAD-dependent aldehyde dehydrogenase